MRVNKILLCILSFIMLFTSIAPAFAQQVEGQEVIGEYTVSYTTDGDKLVIINKREIDTVDVTATKVWDDSDNQDGIRPDSISLQLYADSEPYGDPVSVTAGDDSGNSWTYEWKELPANHGVGIPVVYTVREASEIDGYTVEPSDDGLTLTNKHEPEILEVDLVWNWQDDNNRDGKRPDETTITIKRGDDVVEEIIVPKDDVTTKRLRVPKFVPGLKGVPAVYSAEVTVLDQHYTSEIKPETTDIHFELEGLYEPEKTTVSVSKVWDDADNQDGKRPESVVYALVTDGVPGEPVTVSAGDTGDFAYKWEDLYKYHDQGQLHVYTVAELDTGAYVPTYECSTDDENGTVCVVTNRYEIETKELPVTWKWEDDKDRDGERQDTVAVEVRIGDQIIGTIVFSGDDESSTKTIEVPVYVPGEEGTPAEYTFVPQDLHEEYDYEVNNTDPENPVITGIYEPKRVKTDVSKVWDDSNNQDGKRPATVYYALETDGVAGEPVAVTAGDNGDYSYTWENLYKFHDKGTRYVYTVKEVDSGEYTPSYECTTNEDGAVCVVTNTRAPETKELPITWTWDDEDDRDGKRPDTVTVEVKIGDEVIGTVTFNKDDTSTKTIEVPAYMPGQEGVPAEFTYTVVDLIPEYEDELDNSDPNNPKFIGHYDPERITVNVEKVWEDNENQDGKRPATVTWQLMKDQKAELDPVTVDIPDGSYEWTNLYRYHDGGIAYEYSVAEVDVTEGYEDSYSVAKEDGNFTVTVTNSHEIETLQVEPKIIWDDEDNRDGIRPEKLTIRIIADNASTEYTFVVSEEEDWRHIFEELPVYKDGKEIDYAFEVLENVPGYSYMYDPEDEWTLIYTHRPEEIDYEVEVKWEDDDNDDGVRPDSVSVQLFANGEPYGDPVVVTEADEWKTSWEDLKKFENGEEIVYTVRQLDDLEPVYTTEYNDTPSKTTITNIHKRETKDVPFVVIWDDNSNQDGIRPGSVDLVIKEGDEEKKKQNVDATEDTVPGQFEDMTSKRKGENIDYNINIVTVPQGYTAEIKKDGDTTVIILHHDPADLVTKSISSEHNGKYTGERCISWDVLTITLTVRNNGKNILHNVTVRDRLPQDGSFIPHSMDMTPFYEEEGDTIFAANGRLDVNIGTLNPGDVRTISYKATALNPATFAKLPAYFDYGNQTPLSGSAPDPVRTSNTVDPCKWDEPDNGPSELPKTGFAPGVYTKLPAQRVKYQEYSTLTVKIPRLGVDANIYGVPYTDGNWDVAWLGENVGWLQNTAYPGSTGAGNTVLTGHLTNNYGYPGVFSGLQTLGYGDQVIVTAFGETFTYLVEEVYTVYHDTPQVLSQDTDLPVLTLITCKFYNAETGQYDGRVVVRAKLQSIS